LELFAIFQNFYLFVPRFVPEPLPIFCGTVIGKHCRKVSDVWAASSDAIVKDIMPVKFWCPPLDFDSDIFAKAIELCARRGSNLVITGLLVITLETRPVAANSVLLSGVTARCRK
jgi:hypothetical protein